MLKWGAGGSLMWVSNDRKEHQGGPVGHISQVNGVMLVAFLWSPKWLDDAGQIIDLVVSFSRQIRRYELARDKTKQYSQTCPSKSCHYQFARNGQRSSRNQLSYDRRCPFSTIRKMNHSQSFRAHIGHDDHQASASLIDNHESC